MQYQRPPLIFCSNSEFVIRYSQTGDCGFPSFSIPYHHISFLQYSQISKNEMILMITVRRATQILEVATLEITVATFNITYMHQNILRVQHAGVSTNAVLHNSTNSSLLVHLQITYRKHVISHISLAQKNVRIPFNRFVARLCGKLIRIHRVSTTHLPQITTTYCFVSRSTLLTMAISILSIGQRHLRSHFLHPVGAIPRVMS